jgi:hypothetical protein
MAGTPGKLGENSFPTVLAISCKSGRPAVNRKDKEFIVEGFGSPNESRTYSLLVNHDLFESSPLSHSERAAER